MTTRRIDRNHYDALRVMEIVREQCDGDDNVPMTDRHELLRLLEESAHAYLELMEATKQARGAIVDAWCATDWIDDRFIHPRRKRVRA